MRCLARLLVVTLFLPLFQAFGMSVSIDQVSNTSPLKATELYAGNTHTVWLRVTNDSSFNVVDIANWFRIFSPDGANFGPVTITTIGSFSSTTFDGSYTTQVLNGDGLGADTIQVTGSADSGVGLAASLNEIEWEITFVSRLEDIGKTICIDYLPLADSSGWTWQSASDTLIPGWSTIQCFTISNWEFNPVFSNCPGTLSGPYCDTNVVDLNASGITFGDINYLLIHGLGSVNEFTGRYTWLPSPGAFGSYPVVVKAFNFFSPSEAVLCHFSVEPTNNAPVSDIDSLVARIRPDTVKTILITSDDLQACDLPLSRSALHLNGGTGPLTWAASGAFSYQMSEADSLRSDTIWTAAVVSDGQLADTSFIGFVKGVCCAGLRNNPDCDGGDQSSIADLTYLIGYLFQGSPVELCCPEEANVDGTGQIDIADLVALVDYLFVTSSLPAACP